jgi:hypothetical protein
MLRAGALLRPRLLQTTRAPLLQTCALRAFSAEPRAPWVAPEAVPIGEHLKKYGRDLTQAARDGKLGEQLID